MNQDLQKIKSQLDQGNEQEKLLALSKALNYGEEGLELFINYSLKATDRIKQSAYWILHGYNPYLANNTSNKNINPADTITCLAVSPDNKLLIGGSWKKLWIWYLNTGQIYHSDEAHDNWILSVAISSDGKKIVSASADQTIKIWNLSPWKLDHTLKEHTSWVNAVTITPNNKTVVSGSADKTIKLWNLQTGKLRQTIKNEQELGIVLSLKIDSTGNFLFCGSANNNITIWNLNGNTLVQKLEGHSDWVQSLATIPAENSLLSVSRDGTIKYWKPENKSANNQKDDFKVLWFVLLSGVLDIGSTVLVFKVNWHLSVSSFIISFVIKCIALSFYSPEIIFKELTLDKSQIISKTRINSLGLSQEEKEYIIIGADDSIIKKYYLTNQKIEDFLKDDFHFISSLLISSDKKYIVTASEDWVTVWDLNTREFLHHMKGCSYPKLSKLTIYSDKGQEIYCECQGNFRVQGFDQDGLQLTLNPKDITWECYNNSSLGTIQQNGLLTARKIEGNIQIIARVGKIKASFPITVIEPPKVTKLEIEPSFAKLQFDKTQLFECKVFDQRKQVMSNETISWEVSSPSAGTIDKDGEFRAGKKAGKFEIIASADGKEQRVTIYVIKLDRLEFIESVSELKFEESFQFQVKGIDQYGDDIEVERVTWQVSPDEAVTIDNYGYFTAGKKELEEVKIIASSQGIEKSVTISIIEPPRLARIQIEPSSVTLKPEDDQHFSVIGFDQKNNDFPINNDPQWSATEGYIDDYGLVAYYQAAADQIGNSQVTVTVEKYTATASINVPSILKRIEISPQEKELKPDEEYTFSVTGFNQVNQNIPIHKVEWISTEGGIINNQGVFSGGYKKREVTITAEVGSINDTAKVILVPVLRRLKINPSSVYLEPTGKQQFTVKGFDQFGKYIEPGEIDWTTTGCKINQNGLFTVTSNAQGDFKVKATSKLDPKYTKNLSLLLSHLGVCSLILSWLISLNPVLNDLLGLNLDGDTNAQSILENEEGLEDTKEDVFALNTLEETETLENDDQSDIDLLPSIEENSDEVVLEGKLVNQADENQDIDPLLVDELLNTENKEDLENTKEDVFALNTLEETEALEDDDQSDIDLLPSIEENTNEVVLEKGLDDQLDENQDINSSLLAQQLDIPIDEEGLELIKSEKEPIIDIAFKDWLFHILLKLIAGCLRFIGHWCINEATSSLSATADVFVLAVQYNPYKYFEHLQTFYEHSQLVKSITITADGTKLVSGSDDCTVKVWDLATGELILSLEDHYDHVNSIVISHDNQTIISGSSDGAIKFWDLSTGNLINSLDNGVGVCSMALTTDNKNLIILDKYSIKKYFLDWSDELQYLETFLSQNDNLSSYWEHYKILLTTDDKKLIIGRNFIKVLDIESNEESPISGRKLADVHSVAITYDAKKIAFGRCCFSPSIEIFNLSTKKELKLESTAIEDSCIYALAITPDDQTLISGGLECSIKFWNLETGKLLHSINNLDSHVYALAVTPDGTKIISGHGDGTIKVWGIPELSDV